MGEFHERLRPGEKWDFVNVPLAYIARGDPKSKPNGRDVKEGGAESAQLLRRCHHAIE